MQIALNDHQQNGVIKMADNFLFDQTIATAGKALNLRARRHELIVSNLANADTPGYKAFDLLMDKAIAKQNVGSQPLSMSKTHPNHIPVGANRTDNLKSFVVKSEDSSNMRGDGNTVNMEREMANLAENQLMYKASAQIVAKKLQALRSVIQGGKR
jgi:flagellar basal-body rod protein FlgB